MLMTCQSSYVKSSDVKTIRCRIVLLAALCVIFSFGIFMDVVADVAKDVDIVKGVDAQVKLPFWALRSEVITLRFIQRLPDQSRAYFMAREFTSEYAEQIAQSCVFQSIFKNTAVTGKNYVIKYDLTEWRITYKNKQHGLKIKENWLAEWRLKKVPKAAQIAFEWSLLPTRQRYQPGDFNWGMTIFGLPPGAFFDLHLIWYENDLQLQANISNMQCARDIHL